MEERSENDGSRQVAGRFRKIDMRKAIAAHLKLHTVNLRPQVAVLPIDEVPEITDRGSASATLE